jgi:vancomycin resistance protein YoaR
LDVRSKRLIAVLVAVFVLLVAWDFLFWSGRYPSNCYIEKVDVSGLTKAEALQKLKVADVDTAVLGPISMEIRGKAIQYPPSRLGIYIAPRKTINGSDAFAYRSNYIRDLARRATNTFPKRVLPLSLEIDKVKYRAMLEGFAKEIDLPSKEATFAMTTNDRYKITKEIVGKKLEVNRSLANMECALMKNERAAKVEIRTLYPKLYAQALVKNPPKYLLAEYSTYYGSHDSENRVHNIKLAASRTNNVVVASGEVISLLDMLGEFNRSSGYKEAFVIYNGELEPQYGGGSCQIASTLYNAALLAGLETPERYNHGIYFTIYPLGRDASIYSSSRDLKIKNNTYHPIYIRAFATDRKLTYRIYGTPTGKKVSLSRPWVIFEGERFREYDLADESAMERINTALLNGKPFSTCVRITTMQAGYTTERVIKSRYKLTGDRENVKIVRPEPN